MCDIRDGNNSSNSRIVGGLESVRKVAIGCPDSHQPDKQVLGFAAGYGDKFLMTPDCKEAAADADIIFTDVWASMGQEDEAKARQEIFKGYQVNAELMKVAHSDCMVQHCLPAHRGEEITADVFEAHANEIFDEAENRLHAQKAVMVLTMGQ